MREEQGRALASGIRVARLAMGLTQEELGLRVGVKPRGVSRWEVGSSVPSRSHRKRLVMVAEGMAPNAAAKLAQVVAAYEAARSARRRKGGAGSSPTATPATVVVPPPRPDPRAVLERAIFLAADELDLPARRVRGVFARALGRVGSTGLTLAQVIAELSAWRAGADQ